VQVSIEHTLNDR